MPKLSATRLTKRSVEAAKAGECLSDAEVRGFRLMVTPAGTRRFVATYRRSDGRQTTVTLGSYPTLTTEEARQLAREALSDARRGGDPAKARKDRRDAPTVNDLFDIYVGEYAGSQGLRAKTIADARSTLKVPLAALGKRKVAEVAITDIRKAHGDLRQSGLERGTLGVYRANRALAYLSKMFSLSIERGWRTDNPCKGVRKFPEEQRWRNLSEEEVSRLLGACIEYEEVSGEEDWARQAGDAIRLLLFTGARLQEVLRAEWGQFDLERGVWEKPSSHTKAKRQHWLELEGPALDLLRTMKACSRGRLLFRGRSDLLKLHPRPRADLKRPWEWIRKRAGLEGVRLHDLRRTTASFMLSGGASLATVGKALGHTQASTTQRYAHLAPSVQREALRAAGERLAALGPQRPKVIPLALP